MCIHMCALEIRTNSSWTSWSDRSPGSFLMMNRHRKWSPVSVIDGRPLSNTVGTVLDPIFSLRHRLRLPPGATARVAFWTLVASTREGALDMLAEETGLPVFLAEDPLSAVVMGAGKALESLDILRQVCQPG